MSKRPLSEKGYLYAAYGLNIESCIPCPELYPGRGMPDVHICYGAVPCSLAGTKEKGVWYQATPEHTLLSIDGVARYLVTHGREILIDRPPDAKDEEIRLFLLGSALGALLHQRGLLPLHGCAIEANSGCVVILGRLGSGKSTLAAALSKRGYRVMADDVCAVSTVGDSAPPIVFPGYPQLKLHADAVRKIGERPELLPIVDPELEKHSLLIEDRFCCNPTPLHHIYVLSTIDTEGLDIKPLKGMEKLNAILHNTYRAQFLEGLGRRIAHFKQCAEVAKDMEVSRVTRPLEPFLLDQLANLIEEDFLDKDYKKRKT